MAKKKRISRKKLLKGPDEFVTFWARAIQLATDHQRQISYALGGLLVVVLVFAAFRYFSGLSEHRAYAVFEQGLVHYLGRASGKDPSHAKEKFAEVLNKYSSTSAAQLSLPLYADISYEEGSYDKAIELYGKALDSFSEEDDLGTLVLNSLGYAYEGKKDYNMAAQCFQKIVESEGELFKADAYFNLGRMYEAVSNPEKAREAYDKLVNDYPESANVRMAKEKISSLDRLLTKSH